MIFRRPLKILVGIEQSLEKYTVLSIESIMQVLHGYKTHEPEYIHLLKLQNKNTHTQNPSNPKQKKNQKCQKRLVNKFRNNIQSYSTKTMHL